jgi:hypothetical protein
VLGSDGAGTVAAIGDGVKGFKPGDRAYAFSFLNPKGGFYAEYAAVKADDVSHMPDKLTTLQAGAMPVDAMTALRGLDDTLVLKPAESVMIFGASGGIGHLAVQLAKRIGARVFAIASGIPTVSNPGPSRRLELMPGLTTVCPTPKRSRNSIASSNLPMRRGSGRSRSMSRGAFRLTRPPKHIGRLMSTILASLYCKRLSVSLAGGTSMMEEEFQVQEIERSQPRARSCHGEPGQFLNGGWFGKPYTSPKSGRLPES